MTKRGGREKLHEHFYIGDGVCGCGDDLMAKAAADPAAHVCTDWEEGVACDCERIRALEAELAFETRSRDEQDETAIRLARLSREWQARAEKAEAELARRKRHYDEVLEVEKLILEDSKARAEKAEAEVERLKARGGMLIDPELDGLGSDPDDREEC